jgi:hypothetical protein
MKQFMEESFAGWGIEAVKRVTRRIRECRAEAQHFLILLLRIDHDCIC